MSLEDEVKARFSTQRLANLTRWDDPDPQTVNDTVLSLAATDTKAEFARRTGTTFDLTNAYHVVVCVHGVICTLHGYSGGKVPDLKSCEKWTEGIKTMISGRAAPSTDAMVTPTRQTSDERPDHDRSRWNDFVPRSPLPLTDTDS